MAVLIKVYLLKKKKMEALTGFSPWLELWCTDGRSWVQFPKARVGGNLSMCFSQTAVFLSSPFSPPTSLPLFSRNTRVRLKTKTNGGLDLARGLQLAEPRRMGHWIQCAPGPSSF